MGLIIGGVPIALQHVDGNPAIKRRWPESGPECDIRLICPWDGVATVVSTLLGYISLNLDGSVTRIPPQNLSWAPQMYCVEAQEESALGYVPSPDGWDSWQQSIITTRWSALKYQVNSSIPGGRVDASGLPYTITKFRVSGESYSPPVGAYYVGPFSSVSGGSGSSSGSSGGSPGTPTLLGPGTTSLIRPIIDVSMIRKFQAYLPLAQAAALVGSVNGAPITLGNQKFPRGCLLFLGLDDEPLNDSTGFPIFDISLNFSGHATVDFNTVLTDDGSYQLLNSRPDGLGTYPYPYASFTSLFAVAFSQNS